MITTDGKVFIKRFLGGQIDHIAKSIAIGIGGGAEAVGDKFLNFEVARADIILQSYDFVNNKIVFKASIPSEYSGKIYEVGLWTLPFNSAAGDFTSRLISTFDSQSEVWSTGSYVTTNTRIGLDSLRLAPSTSTTATSTQSDVFLDVSGNSGADKFYIAFNNGNANASSVRFRFKTDSANYFTFTIASPPTGYNVTSVLKSAAVSTGTPSWANITLVEVEVVAGAGGAAQVDFDGIRIEDVDTLNPDYVMVARELLSSPQTKVEGRVQDIEFTLPVSV